MFTRHKLLTCHNLCPDHGRPGLLRRADFPAAVVPDGRWKPRAAVPLPSGDTALVVTQGRSIGVAAAGAVPSPVQLDSAPEAVLAVGSRVMVMSGSGRRTFSVSGSGTLVDAPDSSDVPGGISITAVAAPAVVAYMPDLVLSKSYAGVRELDRVDAARVASRACDVYRAIDSAARAAGCLFRPVAARLRFCRADGSVAFESAPVVLTHPTRAPEGNLWKFLSTDSRTVAGGAFEAPAWRVRLVLPRIPGSDVASARLVVSPLLHASSLTESAVVVSNLGAADVFCTALLPAGPADVYGSSDAGGAAGTLAAMLDTCGSVAATVSRPFDAGGTVDVALSMPSDVDTDNRRVRDALRSAPAADTPSELARFLPPNSFTARACAACGGAVLWAGLRAVPFGGYAPCAFASSLAGDGSWRGYVRVTLADGSTVVRTASGTTGAPVAFQPLLHYPSPLACRIEIGIDRGAAGKSYGSFPLAPDRTGRGACYADPSLRPFTLGAASSYAQPAPTASGADMPGTVAAAPAGAPLRISAIATVASGPVSAVLPARFSQSAWDFGRSRFFIFGADGIHSATVNAAVTAVSAGFVDPRPCPAGASVAVESPHGIIALAGSDVVVLQGSRVTSVATDTDYEALVFDFRRGELWCLSPRSSAVDVYCPSLGWRSYTLGIDTPDASTVVSGAGGSFVASAQGILRLGTSRPDAWLPVHCSVELDPAPRRSRRGDRSARLGYARADLAGAVRSLTVSVTRLRHSVKVDVPDASATFTGTLTSPVRLPVVLPPDISLAACAADHSISITLEGHAAPGFTVKDLS